MHYRKPMLVFLALFVFCQTTTNSQVLGNAANDPNAPVYSDVRPQDSAELRKALQQLRESIEELKKQDITPSERQAALDQLIREQHTILQMHPTWIDWQKPQTVNSAARLLEKMIFEEAAALAPDQQGRQQVLERAPEHLDLVPKGSEPVYAPPLLAPIKVTARRKPTTPSSQDSPEHERISQSAPAAPPASDEDGSKAATDKKVPVAVLTDDKSTTAMHEDNTVLREISDDSGQLVLFGKLHMWLGGAIQADAYRGDGLFNLEEEGNTDSKSYLRRGEGILRASVFEHSEVKVQYDFDTSKFRSLYWRWLSESDSRSITIGNQKEPIGQDWLVGSKFTTAMEPSAPSSAFGSYRSTGIRYSGWQALDSNENPFHLWGDSRTHLTANFGLFGKDIENTNDTDWAATGRVSLGGRKTERLGYHLAASASYRHGEYDRIAPRPGLQDVNRIVLARPEADTQALAGLEGMLGLGSLHGQFELYYSDYSGGEVDAEGWGTYGQVGWLFGGKQRIYHPRWGVWGPIDTNKQSVFEVFGRMSFTRGNDDVNSSNELVLLTAGGNWYYRQFRVSANLIFAKTERDIRGEDNGLTAALRLQYLF